MNFRTLPPPLSDFPSLSLPDINRSKLAGGIVFNMFNGGDQPVNRLTLSFSQGTSDVANPAAMIILSRLMKEGTARHSAGEISDILDFNGAWLKTDPSRHYFDIHLHSINSRLNRVIGLLKDTVYSPSPPEKEFNILRQQLAASSDTRRRTVEAAARKESTRLFFGNNHPFVKLPPEPEDFLAVTIDDVVNLHGSIFSGHRPEISLAGECDSLIGLIEDTFGDLADMPQSPRPVYMPPATSTQRKSIVEVDGACQSAVNISIPSIPRSHPDYINLRYAIVALGGYFGSRLMKQIRETQGLTYNITAQLLGHNEGTEMLISSQTDPTYTDTLISSTLDVLDDMRHNPVTDEDMRQLKAYCMSSLAATLDSPFSIMDYHATIDRMDCGKDYFSRQQTNLDQLTPAGISEMLYRHIDPSKAIITIAGPGN